MEIVGFILMVIFALFGAVDVYKRVKRRWLRPRVIHNRAEFIDEWMHKKGLDEDIDLH